MSDRDKPVNPFGRGERTIIRPNPGGRLPQAPVAQPSGEQRPRATPPARISPIALRRHRRALRRRHPSSSDVAQGSPHCRRRAIQPVRAEEWISTPSASLRAAGDATAPAPPLRVDDLVAPNANPIMRAAGPLLQLLGRLRVALMRASFASLMEQVADAVKFFETDIRSAGISEQQANTAKYILCATADDIVQHIPTEERHVWTQYSMLSRFFGERIGGVRFFEILDHLKVDPLVNYPVLELQHACLALGFQGMHRTSAGGLANAAGDPAQSLRDACGGSVRRSMRDLSPHWRGQALANRRAARPRSGLAGRGGRRSASVRRFLYLARRCWPAAQEKAARGGAGAASHRTQSS